MLPLKISLIIIGSYLIGNINFAVIISRLRGKDIRNLGSGNPGTINMLRNFGSVFAALTLTLDAIKGIVPAVVGMFLLGDPLGVYIGGVCVVLGHMFPVFMKFKGGKGVATSIGVFLVSEFWWAGIIAFAIAMLYCMFFHYGFIASMIVLYSMLAMHITIGSFGYASELSEIARILLICAIVLLVTFAHHKNFVRMFKGTEGKVYVFGIGKPKADQPATTPNEEQPEPATSEQ